MKRMQSRINTYVPTETKERLERLAKESGLKPSDLIRLSLSFAVRHFETHGIAIAPQNQKRKGIRHGR